MLWVPLPASSQSGWHKVHVSLVQPTWGPAPAGRQVSLSDLRGWENLPSPLQGLLPGLGSMQSLGARAPSVEQAGA